MKITRIAGYPVDFPQNPPWGYAKGWVNSAPALLIEVHTDEGFSGWGEGYGPPPAVLATIRALCEPIAIGADPFRTEELWSQLYHMARDFSASGTALAAMSALDIACWDIKGKVLGVPVYTLLGGAVRNVLPCYASAIRYLRAPGSDSALADPVELALDFVQQGFKAMKMTIGLLDIAADLNRVRRVRQSVPETISLIVDANQAYTARQATEVGLALEDLNVAWFEDPLAPDDLPGYEALRRRLHIALAGGETLTTRAGFRDFLVNHVFDIIMPETGLAGGLTECKKIVDMAYAFGIECTPHGYASAVGTAAALHLAATLPHQPSSYGPGLLPFEYAPDRFSRVADLMTNPFDFQAGHIQVPLDRPGLGVEVDRQSLQRRLMK